MAFVYPPFEILLFFMKIPNCLISTFLAFKIKRLAGHLLNYLYYMAYMCWGVFIGTDSILFTIAANDSTLYTIANVLRDVSVVMIALIPLWFIHAGAIIKEGEEIAIHVKRPRLVATFIIDFVLAIVLVLTDSVIVYDTSQPAPYPVISPGNLPPTGDFMVNFDTESAAGTFGSLMFIVFVCWYVYSVVFMLTIQRGQTGKRRQRTMSILLGMLMIPAGIVYFTAVGYFQMPIPFRLLLVLVGHVIWMLSPILVYLGMRLHVPAETSALSLGSEPIKV